MHLYSRYQMCNEVQASTSDYTHLVAWVQYACLQRAIHVHAWESETSSFDIHRRNNKWDLIDEDI